MSNFVINPYAFGGDKVTVINIDNAAGVPAGMPVLIDDSVLGAAPHNDALFSNVQSDGGDIRVYSDASYTTRLPVDLLSTFNTGTNTMHLFTVNSASMAQNDKLYIVTSGAGGSLSQPAVDAQYGSREVWDGTVGVTYQVASHDCKTNEVDGTSFTETGTVTDVTGHNGLPAQRWSGGGNDRVSTVFTGDANDLAFSMLANRIGAGEGGTSRIFAKAGTEVIHNNSLSEYRFVRDFATTNGAWFVTRPATGWKHLSFFQDGDDATASADHYHDGSLQTLTTDTDGSGAVTANSGTLYIGNRAGLDRAFDGEIGEFRLRHATLTAAWALAESNNLTAPSSFASAAAIAPA